MLQLKRSAKGLMASPRLGLQMVVASEQHQPSSVQTCTVPPLHLGGAKPVFGEQPTPFF